MTAVLKGVEAEARVLVQISALILIAWAHGAVVAIGVMSGVV